MAFPHAVLPNDAALLPAVAALIQDRGVGTIVMGHSLNFQGAENPVMEHARAFMAQLSERTRLPIVLEPEQLTSAHAARDQGKNSLIDASAAALILDSYITKHAKQT
jgi:putative transcription antitermination factor YqgF